jgi:hypothetical protein
VEAVAAYQNNDTFQADVHFADQTVAERPKLVAPTAIFGWDFVVPEREGESPEEDLKTLGEGGRTGFDRRVHSAARLAQRLVVGRVGWDIQRGADFR